MLGGSLGSSLFSPASRHRRGTTHCHIHKLCGRTGYTAGMLAEFSSVIVACPHITMAPLVKCHGKL